MGLSGWNSSKKLKLVIDSSKVDEDLTNFPVNITLSSGTGQTGFDATAVFDELITVSGTKKIAITTTISGVETELYTEIERWDWSNEKANLWIKVPTVSSGTNIELILYYDSDHADNTNYIGDTVDTPAQNVWDSNFVGVWHMAQSPPTNNKLLHAAEVSSTGDPANAWTTFGPIDCTGLTRENGTFVVELKCDDPSNVSTSPTSVLELTSAGTHDSEEWAHHFTADDLSKLSTYYKTFVWPMSNWSITGGEVDVTQIDFIRWFAFAEVGGVTIYWKNARVIWPDGGEHILLDSTSNANYGIPEESMTLADLVGGKVGKAIEFDGSDDNIDLLNQAQLIPENADFTLNIVGKIADNLHFFGGGGNTGDSWTITMTRNSYGFVVGGAAKYVDISDVGNVWANFTVIRDGNNFNGYVNGIYDTQFIDAGNLRGTTSSFVDHLAIGARWNNGGAESYADCIIDEVRISNTARSAAWIKATYYSNWDDFVTFSEDVGFVFTNPIPAHLSTVYGTTKQLYLTTTISGFVPEYVYDANFYDGFDVQIGTTVSGINSGSPAASNIYFSTPSGIDYSWYMTATSSGVEDTSQTYTFHNRFLASGTTEINGILTSGIDVRLYLRDTGELLGSTISTISGAFNIETQYNAEFYCVALSPYTDTNSLIYDFLESN